MVFGREELDRNGDSNVGEILKRLPGVTMGGAPGTRRRRRAHARPRQRLHPDAGQRRASASWLLARIAGARPGRAHRNHARPGGRVLSTRAIAGTINIVLREGYQQKDIQLRVTDSIENGLHSPDVSLTVPGKGGALTWLLNGSVGDAPRARRKRTRIDQDVDADRRRAKGAGNRSTRATAAHAACTWRRACRTSSTTATR